MTILLLAGILSATYVLVIVALDIIFYLIRPPYRVTVGPSHDAGRLLKHQVSVKLHFRGDVVHFQRVDLRHEDYEEELAIAVADMRQQARALTAASQIAIEP